MTDNEMNKNQALKEQEAYFLQLVEEKQLELIWHPDRREKCEIGGLRVSGRLSDVRIP